MLQQIQDLIHRNKRLYKSARFDVIDSGETYVIDENLRRSTGGITVQFNGETYEVHDEMRIPKSVTEDSNIICKDTSVEYVIGDVMSNETILFYLNNDQFSELTDLYVRGESKELVSSDQLTIQKLDSMWCIQLTGFKKGLKYSLYVNFSDQYPDVVVRDIDLSGKTTFDLTSMNTKDICCSIPPELSGTVKVYRTETEISEINGEQFALNQLISERLFKRQDSIEERIDRWNTKDISVTVNPEGYSEVTKTEPVDKPVTRVKFEMDDFVKLGTLTVTYPEHISVAPYLSYPQDSEIDSHIKDVERVDESTIRFNNCVYPDEDIRLFSNTFILDNGSTTFDIAEGEHKELELNPTQTKGEFHLTNDMDSEVFCKINGETAYISQDDSASIEVRLSDSNDVEITEGENEIVNKSVSRKDILSMGSTISEIHNSLS